MTMSTVASNSCAMLTMNMSPPNWTNIEMVSTSEVTRETSDPRRSVFWVSTDRSWMWRNALIRGDDALVGGALDHEGDEQLAHRRQDRQPDGDPDATTDLRRQLDAALERPPRGEVLTRLDAGVVHRRCGSKAHRSAPTVARSSAPVTAARSAASRAYAVTSRWYPWQRPSSSRWVPWSTTRPSSR